MVDESPNGSLSLRRSLSGFLLGFLMLVSLPSLRAADLAEARNAYYAGEYEKCAEICRAEVERGIWNDYWSRLLMECLLTTGQYQEACAVYESVQEKFANSIPLRISAATAYRFTGQADKAKRMLDEIPAMVDRAPWRFNDRENSLAIGAYLLHEGADARLILETFFDRVLKSDPEYVNAYMAIGRLAIDKADYAEAAKSLEKAAELRPEDPEVHYLLFRAWAPSDGERAKGHLAEALRLNPFHLDSLLWQARGLIDAEQYTASERVLNEVLDINDSEPRAFALKAAIAHLRGEYLREGEFRTRALSKWNLNPEVDYLAGLVLSKHYRFEEGVKYQRRALQLSPLFRPAKFQLAQDLLRSGKDAEGWTLVAQVAAEDKYNVVAFNLRTLQQRLAEFTTLEVPGFVIRMNSREAQIYGPRVVAILQEAKAVLTDKYQVELDQPTTVEIFDRQSDFAIRTFGLPGGAGFLGVCFGPLVTANSPASQGETPSNWESVLWHEFCHVITLQKTNNRMPRWLSEGISVYEEVERDSRWGQSMNPNYKRMLLGEDFVPLSELSSAFLNPKSGLHLEFAYFESSLAVKYLMERHGLPRLLKLLDDLGLGVTIDEAFSRLYGDAEVLDQDFQEYTLGLARDYLPDMDFGKPTELGRASLEDIEAILEEQPGAYFAHLQRIQKLIAAGELDQALQAVNALETLFPGDVQPGGCLEQKLAIARALQDQAMTEDVLEEFARLTPDQVPVLIKLLDIKREAGDWDLVQRYAEQLLAVQPLLPNGHASLAEATRQLGTPAAGLASLRALQEMEPLDPAELHFRVAELLTSQQNLAEARIEVLQALEYSPRYRAALDLLVEIHGGGKPQESPPIIRVQRPTAGNPPRP